MPPPPWEAIVATLPPLPRGFYEPSAEAVAPRLLGQILIRREPRGLCAGLIVETEAYLRHDPACHAFRGETARNRSMFGPPGHAYLYFIYGNHWCLNAVCGPAGIGEAVLVRALEPVAGWPFLLARRPAKKIEDLTNGPAKLCAALALDRSHDGADLCDPASPIYIAAAPAPETILATRGPIVTTTRVGIVKAADWPLRFYLEGSRFVSRRPRKPKNLD